jgi:hypothetical protein
VLFVQQNVVYLGRGGDITAETRALLMANNVNHGDFSQEVLNSLAPLLPAKASKQSQSRADTGEYTYGFINAIFVAYCVTYAL